jgi:hypothetical protein
MTGCLWRFAREMNDRHVELPACVRPQLDRVGVTVAVDKTPTT